VTPDGILSSLMGPYPGTFNDAKISIDEKLPLTLRVINLHIHEQLATRGISTSGETFSLFGDKGFANRDVLMSSYTERNGHILGAAEKSFNYRMATGRIAVENMFGRILQLWCKLDLCSYWKLGVNHPDEFYAIGGLLTNFVTLLERGNSISLRFGVLPPSLLEYLSLSKDKV